MNTRFLSKEYIAVALISSKNKIFHENFITMSELNQFEQFLQKEFDNNNLNIVITSDLLDSKSFNMSDGVITMSSNCSFNMHLLPIEILNILSDTNLIIDFFMKLEQEKIENLKKIRTATSKLYKKTI